MMQGEFALLLIVLYAHVCHVSAVYGTEHPSRRTEAQNEITDTNMALGDRVLVDIERRLSSLESDNRRLMIENQRIHKTNMDLKQEMQQIMQKNVHVRRFEIENRHCMNVIKNTQGKMKMLEEEIQKMTKTKKMTVQRESTASTDINRNKDVTWTTEKHGFPNSVPYSVLESLSSPLQQAERSGSNGNLFNIEEFNDYRDTGVIDSFVNDLPTKSFQTSKNMSLASVYTSPRTTQGRSRTNERATSTSTVVAFHARLSSDVINPGNDQTIILSDVLTNEGSAYERFSGHFTSPVSGVYVFCITAVTFHNKKIELELIKNGNTIGKLISVNREDWGTGSNTVIAVAQHNDHFWVRVNDKYHDTGTVLDHYFTTFSGFLLH